MNVEFLGLTWASAQNIVVLPIVIVLLFLIAWKVYRTLSVYKILASPKLKNKLLLNASRWKVITKALLMSVGVIFLFLALLSPSTEKKEETVAQEGRDIFIALDISRSMLATDCEPNRLTWAKTKIKQLTSLLKCERVGLILFSGSAFVQCPLTTDYSSFYMFLDHVDVETISSGTTALDQALNTALNAFDNAERKTKLFVVFTDGEDFSTNLAKVKEKAQTAQMTIFTCGVGTEQGAPIPTYDKNGKQTGSQRDKDGNIVISRLNTQTLQSLASDAGGTFIHCTNDRSDLNNLVAHIEQFEKEKFDDRTVDQLENRYPYFLAISFISFALEWII